MALDAGEEGVAAIRRAPPRPAAGVALPARWPARAWRRSPGRGVPDGRGAATEKTASQARGGQESPAGCGVARRGAAQDLRDVRLGELFARDGEIGRAAVSSLPSSSRRRRPGAGRRAAGRVVVHPLAGRGLGFAGGAGAEALGEQRPVAGAGQRDRGARQRRAHRRGPRDDRRELRLPAVVERVGVSHPVARLVEVALDGVDVVEDGEDRADVGAAQRVRVAVLHRVHGAPDEIRGDVDVDLELAVEVEVEGARSCWCGRRRAASAASDSSCRISCSLPCSTDMSPANPSSAGARRQCRCWLSGEGSICSRRRSSRLLTEWPPVSGERMPTTRLNSTNFCASVSVVAAAIPALSRSSGASSAATSRHRSSEGTTTSSGSSSRSTAMAARPSRSWHDCEKPLAMVKARAGRVH